MKRNPISCLSLLILSRSEALMDAIDEFEGAVVMVTHSELILNRLNADQLIVCHANRQTCFQGTYAEFLEKVGWEEEEAPSAANKANKYELERKKQHEERMALKAQLKPLEIELRRCQKRIAELEKQQKTHHERLALLSQEGALDQVHEVTRALEKVEKELDACYSSYLQAEEELGVIKKQLH